MAAESLAADRSLSVHDLGLVPYEEGLRLQAELAAAVTAGQASDALILLEHPPTYTCGRGGGRDHILATEVELAGFGAKVVDVDRGGDVTFHGPGQLVAYPIINLFASRIGRDYRAYLRSLEEVLISVLADFAISSFQIPGLSGVWVKSPRGEEKIAAIGVKVDGRGVTTHGIALNVTVDLSYFSKIIPCGIMDKGVTSVMEQITSPPAMEVVKATFASRFKDVFGYR